MKPIATVPTSLDPAVINLLPETARPDVLTPDTPVLAINRSPRELVDKFDGLDYRIPGHAQFMAPYAAVKHFQDRLIVPGTRVLGDGTESYIGIIGPLGGKRVDPDERLTLFDEHDQTLHDGRVEGIDREALDDPKARRVEVQAVRHSGARQARRSVSVEANAGGALDPAEVLQPSGESAARAELDAARADGWKPTGGGRAVDLGVTMPASGQAPNLKTVRQQLRNGER